MTDFELRLTRIPGGSSRTSASVLAYPNEYYTVHGRACFRLQALGVVEFSIRGCGLDWSVIDVETELQIVVEELPSLLASARGASCFALDLFGQGVSRRICFRGDNRGWLDVECEDLITEDLVGTRSYVGRTALEAQLIALAATYVELVDSHCHELLGDRECRDWCEAVRAGNRE